jgi:ribosomal protein S27E
MGFLCKVFGHKWEHLPNECSRRCRVCGTTETIEHQWQLIEGQCREKCLNCGKTRDIQHTFIRCECTRCGKVEHQYEYVDGEVTDLQRCKSCGKYYLSPYGRARTDEKAIEAYASLITLHGEVLPQVFNDAYLIRKITGYAERFPDMVIQILDALDAQNIQRNVIAEERTRVKELKETSSLTQEEIRRQEYDANADEGIFHGGVRGGR